MGHLGEGALRRLIDEPLASSQADRQHVENCSTCRERSIGLAGEAEAAAALLAVPAFQPDTAVALARVRTFGAAPAPASRRAWARWSWTGPRLVRPLALALAVVGLSGVATATAVQFVARNYPSDQGVVAVTVTNAPSRETVAGLPDLSKYGTSKMITKATMSTVMSAAEAASLSGLTLPPAPAGYADKPTTYTVMTRTVVSFTFDEAMAKKAAADAGKPAPIFPTGIDKTTLTVSVGPAVAIAYGTINRTDPLSSDVLAEAVSAAPVLTTSTGVTPSELLAFLVKQPGIAQNQALVQQIRDIGGPLAVGKLVIPVPADMADQSNVTLSDRTPAVVIAAKVGIIKGIVWEKTNSDGKTVVYAIGGHFDNDQLLRLANAVG